MVTIAECEILCTRDSSLKIVILANFCKEMKFSNVCKSRSGVDGLKLTAKRLSILPRKRGSKMQSPLPSLKRRSGERALVQALVMEPKKASPSLYLKYYPLIERTRGLLFGMCLGLFGSLTE